MASETVEESANANVLIENHNAVSVAEFVKMVRDREEVPMAWIQWECTERSLERRAILLSDKVMQIAGSKRIDPDRLGVGFINSQHGANTQAYMDEFVFYDLKNGNVEFRVIPYRKVTDGKERAHVYHSADGWKKPVFSGRWPDVRKWFNQDDEAEAAAAEKKAVVKGPRDITKVQLPKSVRVPKRQMAQTVAAAQQPAAAH